MPAIEITANADGSFSVKNNSAYAAAELDDAEMEAAKIILACLSSEEPLDVQIEQRSKDYVSLVTRKVYDFARLKVGKKVMWFSVALSPADQKKYAADPRFVSAKKNRFHWKVPFSTLSELKSDGELFHCAYTWAHQQP